MTSFKILGMAEEGKCEHCGANCPKRRVYVMPVDADGCHGEVECWGVICASKVRGGNGTASDVKYLSRFARAVDEIRDAVEAGGGEAEIRKVARWGYPWNLNARRGVVEVWCGMGTGKPDAEIPLLALAN